MDRVLQGMDCTVATGDREYLRYLTFKYARLSQIYYWQAVSLWIRVKHHIPTCHRHCVMAMCFNIAVHFLGPQLVCKRVHIFKYSNLFTVEELAQLHTKVVGYAPAEHLDGWQVARTIQWCIFFKYLNGRVQ